MSRKFEWFFDSGANVDSCLRGTITLDQLGYSEKEWDSLTDDQQEDIMRDIAWDKIDWGWYEITP